VIWTFWNGPRCPKSPDRQEPTIDIGVEYSTQLLTRGMGWGQDGRMPAMRVAVIGGGPAGLCAAMLLKRQHREWDVTLFERHPAQTTFGYGVGLRWAALDRLATFAPACADDIRGVSHPLATQSISRDGVTASVTSTHGLGVSRNALLSTLARHASDAGVQIRTGVPVSRDTVHDADITVAADGAGSQTRQSLAEQLGVSTHTGDLRYLWCGADARVPGMTLSLTRTAAGPMAAHVMPYRRNACTFQVDAAADVIDGWDPGHADQPVARSRGIAMLAKQYADLLGGARLQTRQPSWSTFTTVRCERWSAGTVVLLGDAVHTAHYSVGSGTALAIEDAVALVEALAGSASIKTAFEDYQRVRQPHADHLQRRADRSQRWWSTLRVRYDLPLPLLLLSYLSRTGALRLAELAELDVTLLASCLPDGGGGATADGILAVGGRVYSPLAADRVVTFAMPPGGAADHVAAVVRMVDRGASHVRIVGDGNREGLLDRMELAELLRARTNLTTIVRGDAGTVDDLALGVLCQRTDLVEIPPA
jgi:anthraniloyl-CoA monooxygenase